MLGCASFGDSIAGTWQTSATAKKAQYSRREPRRLSELNNAASHSDGDRLGPIVRPQFRHNMLDVCLHRLFRDEEPFCDITVAISASELTKNLYFASCELFVAVIILLDGG